jgi:hypothetical protein
VTEPDDVELFRRTLAPHVRGDMPRSADCPDDDTLAAMAEGALGDEDRATAIRHLSGCARCRSQVASVARALADPDVVRELRTARGRRRRAAGWQGWATVAAAAMLLLFAWPQGFNEVQHRSAPITAAPAPTAVRPVGTVAEAPSLSWTPVNGADRYRVTLFDAQLELLYEVELADTIAVLPDSLQLTPGETYWWRAEARIGFDRQVDSGLTEFAIARDSAR